MPLTRLLGLLALLALLLALPNAAAGRTYRIATTPWAGWAFLDVADAKGFWRDQGLKVELHDYPDGASYLDAQLAGLVDLSCGMVGDIVWIHTHREPVKILLETDWSAGGDRFFIRRGRQLSELAGRPLGLYQARYSLPYFLKLALGADYRLVEASPKAVIRPPDLLAQFRAGRLDMGVLCDPFAGELGTEAVTVATSADPPGSIPEALFGFRDVIARMPPEDLRGLVGGVLRAMAWMRDPDNAAELYRILQARSFRAAPLHGPADLAEQLRRAPVHTPERLRQRNAAGGGLEAYLAGLRDFLRVHDPAAPSYQPRELFDPQATARLLEGRD